MNNNSKTYKVFRFHITDQEKLAIEKNAQLAGLSVSNYIRSYFPELNKRNYPKVEKA